ncbi:hexokinase-1 [Trichonephila clavipes]|nr:hexokinase-1 [Trichonephila clavipes]
MRGHGCLVVKVADSCLACHVFESCTAEDPPCRGGQCSLNISRLKHPPIGVVWNSVQFWFCGIWSNKSYYPQWHPFQTGLGSVLQNPSLTKELEFLAKSQIMTRNIILKNVGEDLTFKILPDSKAEKVKLVTDPYLLPDSIIKCVIETFESELELGLKKNPNKQSSLQMANTFVPKLLSGNEKGAFLALDLGGTNFRVILLTFQHDGTVNCFVQYYTVPEPLRLGEGELLFDFLAECMHDFLEKKGLLGKKLPLGFCFSFPMIQTGIDEGILVTWTKSFNCKNVVGKEVVQMLKHAFSKKKGVNVDIVAIVNDATGTMMMGSYIDKRTAIGMILGTGCNAAYFEKVERIEKWEGKHPGIDEVIIDIEWGAFGDNGVLDFMKTEIDKDVDQASLLVNSFT